MREMMVPTTDERPIAAESSYYNSRLIRRVDLTESLCFVWVAMDGTPIDFAPGQYLTIGVESNGKIVQRPYSVASSPRRAAEGYEYYVRLVDGGLFTPLLWRLPIGHGLRTIGPKGKFTLEPDDDRTHLFISSGTGIAPFMAMMETLRLDGAPRRAVLLNGCSYADELGYREILEGWQASGHYPVIYVPSISRPDDPRNAGWSGRTGRAEAVLPDVLDDLGLTAADTIAYICGNPDMILSAEAILLDRGFPEPQIRKELYWPKGKAPKGPAMGAAPEDD